MKKQLRMVMQMQIESEAVMSDFCWAYAHALLQKLKALKEEKRLTEQRNGFTITLIAGAICEELSRQTHHNRQLVSYAPENASGIEKCVDELIAHAEEFLAI